MAMRCLGVTRLQPLRRGSTPELSTSWTHGGPTNMKSEWGGGRAGDGGREGGKAAREDQHEGDGGAYLMQWDFANEKKCDADGFGARLLALSDELVSRLGFGV